MSAQQKKSELLTFGYVNKTYKGAVPFQLIKLMQLFYDQYYYWTLKANKLQQFINASNGQIISLCTKSFKIKGIEFEIISFPNGNRNERNGLVIIGLTIKHLPKNIEYFTFYEEIKCETSDSVIKGLIEVTKSNSNGFLGGTLCQLSELKDMEIIYFNCMVNIKHIKYKKECNKIDYYCPINKIQKYYKCRWNINHLLMEKCKKMLFRELIYSDNFDNNWCLILGPNGLASKGDTLICLACLSFPPKIKSMDIKVKMFVNEHEQEVKGKLRVGGRTTVGVYGIMKFTDFQEQESLSLNATLEIMNIYNENDKIIVENEWEKYGII